MAVNESAEEDVDNADEGLCAEHALPEVPGVAHLSEESDEEESTTVGVDHGVDAVELAGEAGGLLHVCIRGWAGKGLDWLDGLQEG